MIRLLSPVSPPDVAQDSTHFMMKSLGRLDRFGARRLGFHDQNIAIGEHIKRSRMLQPGSQGLDLQRRSATVGVSPGFQPTTDATCIGGKRYCCCAGKSGLAPICVFGSGALSLHAVKHSIAARPAMHCKCSCAANSGVLRIVTYSDTVAINHGPSHPAREQHQDDGQGG